MADSSDDLLTALFVFALILLLLLVIAVWRAASPRSKPAVRSQVVAGRASRAPHAAVAGNAAGRSPARRRVISLHSTTPGQSPHEYNIGDNQGTRGSALVRAA
jgi:hypothetical protein